MWRKVSVDGPDDGQLCWIGAASGQVAGNTIGGMAENFDRYVTISEACRLTGCSRGTLRRWIEDDPGLRTSTGAKGAKTVWLADVLAKQNANATGDTDPEDDDDDDAISPAIAQARVFGEMAKALQLQNQHVERMHEPTTKLIEMLSQENVKLRQRIDELEKKNAEMLATHERHITEEWTRQREEQRERRAAARADQAMQTILRFAPALVAGVAGHFGQRGAQETILVDAVNQLTDDQFRAMVASGLFSPDVIALIDRIRATGKPNGPQSQNGSPSNVGPQTQAA